MTLKELAKIIGVSISTVSKALSDSPEIGETTKRKIKELAKLHHYQPNKLAVNLKSGSTKTIGVLIPSIQNNFFAKVLNGIEKVIDKSSYKIVISITHESLEKEANSVITLSNGLVDGFIIAVAEETQVKQNFEHYKTALNNNKPILMFDRVLKSLNTDKVIVDDREAVFNVTKELIKNGRKSIALVTTIHNLSVGLSRKQGYKDAVSYQDDALIVESTLEQLENNIEQLLSSKTIDAIIALDEDASLASLKVAKRKQLSIPKQIAIIGYADEKIAGNLTPGLTTIDQHGVAIGEKSAEILINKLNSQSKEIQKITIESTINKRETT